MLPIATASSLGARRWLRSYIIIDRITALMFEYECSFQAGQTYCVEVYSWPLFRCQQTSGGKVTRRVVLKVQTNGDCWSVLLTTRVPVYASSWYEKPGARYADASALAELKHQPEECLANVPSTFTLSRRVQQYARRQQLFASISWIARDQCRCVYGVRPAGAL